VAAGEAMAQKIGQLLPHLLSHRHRGRLFTVRSNQLSRPDSGANLALRPPVTWELLSYSWQLYGTGTSTIRCRGARASSLRVRPRWQDLPCDFFIGKDRSKSETQTHCQSLRVP
jgi:hypothetical protein